MRPSSSGTIRRYAESRSRSEAARPGAASSRPQVTRRALRGQIRDADVARRPSVPASFDRPARLPEIPHRLAGGVRDLPVGDATSRTAVSGRGVSRRHRERVGAALGREVALRIKADIRERTALTASAGVAPNKFLAKIASGMEEAGRPDRHRPRARRAVSADAAGRCALGRRPGDGRIGCASAASNAWSMSASADNLGPSRSRRESRRAGCAALPTGSTIVRSSRIARRSRAGPRTRSQRT